MEMKELVVEAKKGDKKALDEIMVKFKGLVYKWSRQIYVEGYEVEDLVSMGNQWIIIAINKYDIDSQIKFEAYVGKTLENNYHYLIRSRAKYNYTFSLNAKGEGEDDEIQNLIEDDINIENVVINKIMLKKLKEEINKLSFEDKELIEIVFKDKRGGLKMYSEEKGINYKKCYNRRNEIINILRDKILE